MLTEMYNKISQTGESLSDRLEDKLTGDFFGTIRYLPFEEGLRHVLSTALFDRTELTQSWNRLMQQQRGYAASIEFWSRHDEGEIDLLIQLDEAIIGIEVKYASKLSSDDDAKTDDVESVNQLAGYSHMMKRLANGREAYLIFLAPYTTMSSVRNNLAKRHIIESSVTMGFMCWQDILEALQHMDVTELDAGRQLMLDDLQALLVKKGFSCFHGFKGKVFEQPVMQTAYSFQSSYVDNTALAWPNQIIRRTEHYVYNNTCRTKHI